MGQNRIEFDNLKLEVVKLIAKKNNRRHKTKQDLIEFQNEIVNSVIENLDDESFENITNLKL